MWFSLITLSHFCLELGVVLSSYPWEFLLLWTSSLLREHMLGETLFSALGPGLVCALEFSSSLDTLARGGLLRGSIFQRWNKKQRRPTDEICQQERDRQDRRKARSQLRWAEVGGVVWDPPQKWVFIRGPQALQMKTGWLLFKLRTQCGRWSCGLGCRLFLLLSVAMSSSPELRLISLHFLTGVMVHGHLKETLIFSSASKEFLWLNPDQLLWEHSGSLHRMQLVEVCLPSSSLLTSSTAFLLKHASWPSSHSSHLPDVITFLWPLSLPRASVLSF